MYYVLGSLVPLFLCLFLFRSGVVSAQTNAVSVVPRLRPAPVTQAEAGEISAVENVLGGHFTRSYLRYKHSPDSLHKGFAQYLDDGFHKRTKIWGVTLGTVVPAVLGLSAFAIAELVKAKREWIYEHRNWVSCETRDAQEGTGGCLFVIEPSDGAYDGDGYNVGIALVSAFASVATVAVLTVGIFQISKRNKQRERLSPLLHRVDNVSFGISIGISAIGLSGTF